MPHGTKYHYCSPHSDLLGWIIERICGRYPNPEEIALCKKDPKIVTLYRCRFKQMDVWDNYSGKDSDTIELEIYEHWLNDA